MSLSKFVAIACLGAAIGAPQSVFAQPDRPRVAASSSAAANRDEGSTDSQDDESVEGDDDGRAEGDADTASTRLSGRVTSTTFGFRETGGLPVGDVENILNHSWTARLFTDVRMRLDATTISGSSWDVRVDSRVRVTTGCAPYPLEARAQVNPRCRIQSGSQGGNEYDVRELHATRRGSRTRLTVGRQFAGELANLRLDGASLTYALDRRWTLLAAVGLHPSRNSRSVTTDYPYQIFADETVGRPVMPLAAGFGGSYRYPKLFGSLGAAAIVPLVTDPRTGTMENPRVFLTDAGTWNPTDKLNIYHYVVFDLQGAGGFSFTNLSLGGQYRPIPALTIDGAIHRVDAETLNSVVQADARTPTPIDPMRPYNYHQVQRIASDSARLSVSLALAKRRFEISTSAQLRQREALTLLVPLPDGVPLRLPATRNAEFQLSVLDRRSLAGFRLGATLAAVVPFAAEGPNRSHSRIARLLATRSFADERLSLDIDASYSYNVDRPEQGVCDNPGNCYGNAFVQVISANALAYYRLAKRWTVMASAGISSQMLRDGANQQPPNLLLSGFARVGYRF